MPLLLSRQQSALRRRGEQRGDAFRQMVEWIEAEDRCREERYISRKRTRLENAGRPSPSDASMVEKLGNYPHICIMAGGEVLNRQTDCKISRSLAGGRFVDDVRSGRCDEHVSRGFVAIGWRQQTPGIKALGPGQVDRISHGLGNDAQRGNPHAEWHNLPVFSPTSNLTASSKGTLP